jgi:hypothetical protein
MLQQFQRLDPGITGKITKQDSVKMQLEVIDRLDDELSGAFVSQHGNQLWW